MTDPTSEVESSDEFLGDPAAALKLQLADAEARAATAKDAQLRAAAELDNVRRRMDRELAGSVKYAAEKVLGELIGVADSLELGLQAATAPEAQLQSLIEGKEMTYRQLMSLLERHGVRLIDPKGELFNPGLHQAVQMVESSEVPPNHVLSVVQKGYKLHERVLRPAIVVVAKAPASP